MFFWFLFKISNKIKKKKFNLSEIISILHYENDEIVYFIG